MAKPVTDLEKLKAVWYKKLADTGFVDVETDEWNLKNTFDSSRFTRKKSLDTYKQKAEYYYMTDHFLNTHAFENELEKVIWEYHCNAVSTRDIADTLTKTGLKNMGRCTVWKVVKKLRLIMYRLYLSK
jgi:hypothetical protein